MAASRLYYDLKPYMPWGLRIGLRRAIARRKRVANQHLWPINEAAGAQPPGWRGWPDGKKFALVLTHDVEGPGGLAKCRDLMELEKQLGFRSSLNFIPEGDYVASRELREDLARNGFEVGVHDLRHDGKLYASREQFAENAKQINHYLKEWGATGFRSGFMHHRLDWAHDLNVLYDASTFDTDPFEPQPDGVNTIFPFVVTSPGKSSYVELPYTLPQDSTLFIILREKGIDIWKRKLDWIVQKGGMALLNVHPDYLSFNAEQRKSSEYPAKWYADFLEYAREQYGSVSWNALPNEVATWTRSMQPEVGESHRPEKAGPASQGNPSSSSSRFTVLEERQKSACPPKRICMISHSFYENDNRIMRYAESLADRGDEVDIFSLKRDPASADVETIRKVRVHRIQNRFSKDQKDKAGYLLPLIKFWFGSSLYLTRKHFQKRYDLIHVHNVPDFLVFAAWFPKVSGAKIILDIHDIVPEFYSNKFQVKPTRLDVQMLKKIEWASATFADHVIISNHIWHKLITARSVPEEKCRVFINHVNQKVFYPRVRSRHDHKRIILFPGGLQWHQGLDIAIRAMPEVLKQIPEAEFHIYGDGNMQAELQELSRSLGLEEKVRFFKPLPVLKIAEVMSAADVGVVPKRADSFGNEAYSTKIMEFMSVGVPVVISATKIDRYYFDDAVVKFFESGNSNALAKALVEVLQNQGLRQQMAAAASAYAARHSWEIAKTEYLKLVDSLCANPHG
ncbi:glycosyltransferase [Pedosphaera parvula]|nr:glycosyltransferase [Pedosphaera parvula]